MTTSLTVSVPTCRAFRRSLLSVTFTLAIAALAASSARAHQFWLAPQRYDPAPGQAVEVGAVAGTGFRGERKPWAPAHALRLVARTSRVIDLSRAATIGDQAWVRFAPADPGGALLAYESGFTSIELPAAPFDAYLKDEGLTSALAARRHENSTAPGRERYRRCAKTWLAGRDAARATGPIGLPLEIVPLSLPGATTSLRLRVLWNGAPLPGALIKTWRARLASGGMPQDAAVRDSIPMAWQGHTDARGELAMPCAQPGEWLASTVTMVPCPERSVADWESTWASLTFLRPEGARTAR